MSGIWRRVAVAAVVLGLSACGGDEPAATPTDTASAVGNAPVPELPAEIAGQLGPLDITGDPLPALAGAEITADPARGLPAPVLVGSDFDDTAVTVDAATNGPTMVVFLAHWCPHCNAEIPRLNELRDAGRLPADLNVVGVSTAINPQYPNFPPSQWFVDKDWTWPVLRDNADATTGTFVGTTAYGVDGFPFVALIDGDGKIAARWSGEREPDEVLAAIATYLNL